MQSGCAAPGVLGELRLMRTAIAREQREALAEVCSEIGIGDRLRLDRGGDAGDDEGIPAPH